MWRLAGILIGVLLTWPGRAPHRVAVRSYGFKIEPQSVRLLEHTERRVEAS